MPLSAYKKGVDNLSPPFGKFRFAAPHFGKVIFWILRIGEYQDYIFDRFKKLFHFAKCETICEV